jgi:putative FmdB family regulatory protein
MAHTWGMPTYTYRCTKCGTEIEAVQKMSDPPLKRCRSCRGKLVRTFHPVGIVLKGSGFHKTDYPSKRGRSEGDGKADAKKDSDSTSSSGTKGSKSKDAGSSTSSDKKS